MDTALPSGSPWYPDVDAGDGSAGCPVKYDQFEQPVSSVNDLLYRLDPACKSMWNGHQSDWVFRGPGQVHCDGLIPLVLRPPERERLRSIGIEEWIHWRDAGSRQIQELREFRLLLQFVLDAQALGLPIPEDALNYLTMRASRHSDYVDDPNRFQYARLKTGFEPDDDLHPWPPSPLWRALALAQHYGLPTRLLDWARNPLRAVYEAASGAARKHKEREEKRAKGKCTEVDAPSCLEVWALNRVCMRKAPEDNNGFTVRMVEPPATDNLYQAAQTGVFTVVRYEGKEVDGSLDADPPALDQLIDDVWTPEDGPQPLRVYRLPQALAPELLRRLSERYITASTAEPDYRGAAKDVLDRLYFDKCFDRYQDRRSDGSCE
jgi:hypothetical protein